MTPQEILEYNKRCAEFLGWKSLSPKTKYCYWKFPEELCFKLRCSEPIHSNNLLFHSDWNWIMEVVESIYNKFKEPRLFIEVYQKWIYEDENVKDFLIFRLSKEALVQAINQFLIWYNKQK